MSNIIYKYQSAADLEYKFFIQSGSKPGFNVLKNKEIEWKGIILDFSIIGASHFVKIDCGGSSNPIIELVACLESDINFKDVFQEKKLVDSHNYSYTREIPHLLKYLFSTELINDCVQNYREFKRKYISNQGIYFDYIFPSNNGLAITSIDIYRGTDKLTWITYHSYPEEKKIIKTQTVLGRGD